MKTLVAALAVIMAAVLAAAYVALPQYIETRLRAASGAELTVERVGWREASIIDVRLGDGLTIATLTARYDLRDLIDGLVRSLTIEGLVLRGAVTSDGLTFQALDPLLADGGDDAWAIPLDTIELRNSRIELNAPMGEITITAEGLIDVVDQRDLAGLLDITILAAPVALTGRLTIAASRAEGYDAQLEITEMYLGTAPAMAGEIAARLRGGRLSVDGALYTPDGALALTAGLTVENGARFDLDAELWVTDPAPLSQASLGQGRMVLSLAGLIPTSSELSELALSGVLDLALDEVSLAGVGDGLSLAGVITVETSGGIVTAASDRLSLQARRLVVPNPGDNLAIDLRALRVEIRPGPDGLAIDGAVAGDMKFSGGGIIAATAEFHAAGSLDLDPQGVPRRFDLRRLTASARDIDVGGGIFSVDGLSLSLAGSPDAFSGTAQGTLSTDSFAAAGLTMTQPAITLETALAYGGGELSLALVAGSSLDATGLSVPGLAPLALHVKTVGESVVAVARDGRISYDLRLALPTTTITTTIEMPALAATVTLPALRLKGVGIKGIMEISGGALELPGQDLSLDGIDALLDLDEGKLRGTFTSRELRHPAVAPLAASGSFDVADGVIAFATRLSDGGALAVDVAGRHELASGAGGASFEMARLTLDPARARPDGLAPGLSGLASHVKGTIAAVGGFTWGGAGSTSEMTLLVEDLSFTTGDVRLERVNAVIAFDSLWPLSTAPAQQFAIGLIDAGLPLTDGLIEFQLRPDGALYVDNAVWRWAGGRLKTQNFLFDPDSERHAFTIEIDDLDLAEIVALSDVDDISATGRLSGRAPVTVTAEGLAITGGWLETAPGGGLLRYAPAVSPAALRQGGEGATLALTVLENFRYESLRIDIDREAGGETEIAVHLRGANADVYDGYPIEFNLNISGPIDQMLRRGLEGYRVPDAVAERLRGFGVGQ